MKPKSQPVSREAIGPVSLRAKDGQRISLASQTQTHPVGQVVPYAAYAGALCLDGPTLTNLELLESSAGSAEGSLLTCLDSCTSAGAAFCSRTWAEGRAMRIDICLTEEQQDIVYC